MLSSWKIMIKCLPMSIWKLSRATALYITIHILICEFGVKFIHNSCSHLIVTLKKGEWSLSLVHRTTPNYIVQSNYHVCYLKVYLKELDHDYSVHDAISFTLNFRAAGFFCLTAVWLYLIKYQCCTLLRHFNIHTKTTSKGIKLWLLILVWCW